MSSVNTVIFTTADGYAIHGHRFQAQQPKGLIIVASATGVPQGFYRKFAQYATAQRYDVITFDYRGVGASKPKSLKGFDMDYRDWARQDLEAVIASQSEQALPIFLIGHSYGGHALGLLENHSAIKAAYFFGVGSGWHGWMPKLESLRVSLMWNVIAPVLTRIKGYLGWSALGMGEDLPLGVYKQWKRWCRFPHYFFDDPDYPEMRDKFAEVTTPIKAATAHDDKWALPQSRDAFVKHYINSQIERIDLEPRHVGMGSIGHMGYFRSTAQGLWPDIFEYFNRYSATS